MKCPQCGSKTSVLKSRLAEEGVRVTRRRQCQGPLHHQFETLEQRVDLSLRRVLIRRSGDARLSDRGFDRDRLLEDVRAAVLKHLNDRETQSMVTDVLRSLEAQLPNLIEPLSDDEKQAHPGFESWISDTVITEAILRRLRSVSRPSQVLYAMSILGREDRKGRSGWSDAGDVLEWLYENENYPDLREAVPTRSRRPKENWFPEHVAPVPSVVIKRDGRVSPFDQARFVTSIRKAMMGRRNAENRSRYVSEWVLWRVEGHQEVLTTQLSVGVMECLRRVDDIAYLRWSSIAKSFDSVTRFRGEARQLLTHPSVALTFNPDLGRADPRKR